MPRHVWYIAARKEDTKKILERKLFAPPEAYSEPCKISKMEIFAKKINS